MVGVDFDVLVRDLLFLEGEPRSLDWCWLAWYYCVHLVSVEVYTEAVSC